MPDTSNKIDMKMQQYIHEAVVTESLDLSAIMGRIVTHPRIIRLLHSGIGLATEGGELLDALKKHIFYGAPLDTINLKEEMGDLLWYIAIALHEMDWSFEEVAQVNINKLRARYPDKFSGYNALNRDTAAERDILEGLQLRRHTDHISAEDTIGIISEEQEQPSKSDSSTLDSYK